jgi:DNA-binding MarR family transcriptional regulator
VIKMDVSGLSPAEFETIALARARSLTPSVDEHAMRASFNLIRTTNSLVQALEETVHRPSGWSWAGFRVMFIIWMAGEIEARNISRLASVTRQTVSSVLGTLERDGLIMRTRSTTGDTRLVAVRLSKHGEESLTSAFARHNALESRWFSSLTAEEQDVLAHLLARVLEHSESPGV